MINVCKKTTTKDYRVGTKFVYALTTKFVYALRMVLRPKAWH